MSIQLAIGIMKASCQPSLTVSYMVDTIASSEPESSRGTCRPSLDSGCRERRYRERHPFHGAVPNSRVGGRGASHSVG